MFFVFADYLLWLFVCSDFLVRVAAITKSRYLISSDEFFRVKDNRAAHGIKKE